MAKIRTLSLSVNDSHGDDIARGLRAACSPFGSLSPAVPDLMLAYVNGRGHPLDPTCTVDAAVALLRELRNVDGYWSEVLLGCSRVQLVTPTSRTVIELRRFVGLWELRVDFGPSGSDNRADQILEQSGRNTHAWKVEYVDSADADPCLPAGSDLGRVVAL